MALKGKKPSDRKSRLMALMDGPSGVGKTTACCQMPCPYIIDTEDGCRHYGDMIEKVGGAVMGPDEGATDLAEVIREVKSLASEEHPYKTLVIDPVTVLWDTEVDAHEQQIADHGTSGYFDSGFQRAKKPFKRLMNLVIALDMNVVFTAHSKTLWREIKEEGKKAKLVAEGTTFDGYKKLDYVVDLWVTLARGDNGAARTAHVRKTRIKQFEEGATFPWSYEALVERFGKDKLERAVESIQFATDKQVAEFRDLFGKLSPDLQSSVTRRLKDVDGDPSFLSQERIEAALVGMRSKVQEAESEVPF